MIYLDYASTTPLANEVLQAMLPYLNNQYFANPSSVQYALGKNIAAALAEAAEQFAAHLHADADEIVWTSGATESNNLALQGAAYAYQHKGKHIISVKTEHKAVLDVLAALERQGFNITLLDVNEKGQIDLQALAKFLSPDTILVSIMHVNNETGLIHDLPAIAELVKSYGALLHVDAAQSFGKLPIDLQKIPIDLMSVSAHKIYGPKGIGALYVRKKPFVRLKPLFFGGGQQQSLRPGTLAAHQIMGFVAAAQFVETQRENRWEQARECQKVFRDQLNLLPGIMWNSDETCCVPHILNFSVEQVDGPVLLEAICKKVAITSTSACQSQQVEASHVLTAMGHSDALAHASYRVSFGFPTTLEEVKGGVSHIAKTIRACLES